MKKNIAFIGNLNINGEAFNGQTVKTRDYFNYLQQRFPNEKIDYVDTCNFRSNPFKSLISLFKLCKNNRIVVLLLGVHAGSILIPFVCRLQKLFKFKIFLSVVGGGIMYDKKREKKIIKYFNKMESIYFETKVLTNHYSSKFTNIMYAPCFTNRILSVQPSLNTYNDPIRFCTYSRVCKEKGITSAIEAVKYINSINNKLVCTLDVIGNPSQEYELEFNELLQANKDFVNNLSYLSGNDVLDKLSKYDAMLFPTYYPGEGFPIAVVECLSSGVPVIASDWHFNSEIIESGKTGYVYDLDDEQGLVNAINSYITDKKDMLYIKKSAYEYSKNFEPTKVLADLFDKIDKELH